MVRGCSPGPCVHMVRGCSPGPCVHRGCSPGIPFSPPPHPNGMCADNDNDHDGGGNDKNDDIEDEDDDLNEVDNDVFLCPAILNHMFNMCLMQQCDTHSTTTTATTVSKCVTRRSHRCILHAQVLFLLSDAYLRFGNISSCFHYIHYHRSSL